MKKLLIVMQILGVLVFSCQNAPNPVEENQQGASLIDKSVEASLSATDLVISGSGFLAAGSGMETQPGLISLEIPGDVTIKAAYLYWEGRGRAPFTGDDEIVVDGSPVTGVLLPEDANDKLENKVYCYRADITELEMLSPGLNELSISGMDFPDNGSDGIGLLVVIDDGESECEVTIREICDFAFIRSPEPDLQTTVPQTYTFAPADMERTVDFLMFVGDVEDSRPTKIDITIDGATTEYINILGEENDGTPRTHRDGPEWDTVLLPLTIPAGVGELTAQAFSYEDGSEKLPASLVWVVSALCVPEREEPPGDQGCTPGYWKNHPDSWEGLSPDDPIESVFEAVDGYHKLADKSLLEALNFGGGRGAEGAARILLRTATGALLNALHSDVAYPVLSDDIIFNVNAALTSGDRETMLSLKDELDRNNNIFCPLNGFTQTQRRARAR